MSFSTAAPDLKIWDNAAFVADDPAGAKQWLPLQPISINVSNSPDLDHGKKKPSKKPCNHNSKEIPNHDNVDAEIEQLEKEIRRLYLKLDSLRIKKAERELKIAAARRGRIVPAKFMEQKPSPGFKKIEESPARFRRRGLSLGPLEIHGSVGKSCFQKLECIREENSPIPPQQIKEKKKRQSLSMSPVSRKKTISELRKGISTVSAMKSVKKEDSILKSFSSKKLFEEKHNQISCRNPSNNAKVRLVASRYSLAEPEHKRRKWNIQEPQNRSFSLGESSDVSELPSSPTSIMKIGTMLPRIRTLRNKDLSPRDSGCAKRASKLVDMKTHFSMEDDQVGVVSPCKFPEL